MKLLVALLTLAIAQLSAIRYVSPAKAEDQLGGFSIQLLNGWSPKAPGEKLGKGLESVREPSFQGPHGMQMQILWQQKPDPEVMKAFVAEMEKARQQDPEGFRDLNVNGLHGGIYTLTHKSRKSKSVWIIAKMTYEKDLVNLTIESDRPLKTQDMDQIEIMVRSLQPYR